jgi:hypothetical protein
LEEILPWIISTLLSIIGLMGGFVLWYVASIFKKTESLDEQIKRNSAKVTSLREHFNENVSKVFTSQQSIGQDLVKVRRTLVGTTMVLRRRQAEIAEVVADGKRTSDRVGQINRELEKHKKVLIQHNSDIIKLKNGNILVKGNKDG